MKHFFQFCKTILPNYRISKAKMKEAQTIKSNLERYTLTSEDFQKLTHLSEKRHQSDQELIKFWKKVGDKMGFDYRTARGIHPHPSPELVAIPIPKTDAILKPA